MPTFNQLVRKGRTGFREEGKGTCSLKRVGTQKAMLLLIRAPHRREVFVLQ